MPIDATMKAALAAQETAEVLVALMTIDHPNLTMPVRVSSDSVDTPSRGQVFVAYPFDYKPPAETETGPLVARLEIDNVGEAIAEAVQAIDTPATVKVEYVLASSPNTVQLEWPTFELTNVEGNEFRVTGDLTIPGLRGEPVGRTIDPSGYPGLF